ncbi:GNAT family N-acetyltransferase [Sandarakinorhabdus sp.]|uniref:GNAT family N-acetyltransferase n=1 Tax=Sandarakinorhabdus sp. TaxID=1916663 RepID=UPI00286D9D14|nr:GNAT family N-acetyltransferase [Sandarakinorhabdus sp.]
MALRIRPACLPDVPALEPLIAASARALGQGYYSATETEAAIEHVFGVDTELVDDGSYLVATRDGEIAGCGGWSRRTTLFGGDRYAGRASGLLDPALHPAKIRAFFVAPGAARQGVGAALLLACESAAAKAGFLATELMATLPGQPFYAAHGYRPDAAVVLDLGGIPVRFVPMRKQFSVTFLQQVG